MVTRAAAAFTLIAVSGMGVAEEFRIHYAEPVTAHVTGASQDSQKAATQALTFDAFGRRFDILLEPNDRLLARLPAADRSRLSKYRLLKGSIAGIRGSWARITLSGDAMYGAIWDGNDLYTLAPSADVAQALIDPMADASAANVIYRLADTQSDADRSVCVALVRPGADATGARSTAAAVRGDYLELIRELRERTATLVPDEQIEVAVLGDFEFRSRYGSDSDATVLARMNIVDGIFAEQVGVAIVVAEIRLSDNSSDPFTSDDAQVLINEVAQYRDITPGVRERGLAHLMTGRDLAGNTLGIAYIDALCEPFFGVSISEGWRDQTTAALIAAHEFGHNFGAPHDTEAGSACAASPPGFLMEPFLNFSSTFSSCSLLQMAPSIAAAACIGPSSLADGALEVPPSPVPAVVGDPILHSITLRSVGTAAVDAVSITLEYPNPLQALAVESIVVEGTPCTPGAVSATCPVGSIPAGESRRVEMRLRGSFPGTFRVSARLTAGNDRNSANNTGFTDFVLESGVRITVADPLNGFARQPLSFNVDVSALGTAPLQNAQFIFERHSLAVDPIVPPVGSCSGGIRITCALGTLSPGSTISIPITVTGPRSGSFLAQAQVTGSNGGTPISTARNVIVNLAARADVAVAVAPTRLDAVPGQAVPISVTVTSAGPEPAENVRVDLSPSALGLIQSVEAGGGNCTLVFSSYECAFGTLAAGATRTLTVTVRGDEVTNYSLFGRTSSSTNDVQGNDERSALLIVRHAADIAVTQVFPIQSPETLAFQAAVELRSLGSGEARDVTVSVALPASFNVLAATIANGSCTTVASTVNCSVASVQADRSTHVSLNLRGNQVGTFTAMVNSNASNDGNPQNNAREMEFRIVPLVDAQLQLSTTAIELPTDGTVDFFVTVLTGGYDLAQVSVRISDNILSLQATPVPGITCGVQFGDFICDLGALPAGSTRRIDLRGRATCQCGGSLFASVLASDDVNPANNVRSASVNVLQYSDAGVSIDPRSMSARINEDVVIPARAGFDFGWPLASATVTATLPAGLEFRAATTSGVGCTHAAGVVTCDIGSNLRQLNRTVQITVRGAQTGVFTTVFRIDAPSDRDPTNNEISAALSITPAPPPPPAPPPGSNDDGGGGSLGLSLLLALLLARFVAVSRRFQP